MSGAEYLQGAQNYFPDKNTIFIKEQVKVYKFKACILLKFNGNNCFKCKLTKGFIRKEYFITDILELLMNGNKNQTNFQ